MVGDRDGETAAFFIDDLKDRLANRVQLTTDGLKVYLDAVHASFADVGVDYAQLVKMYGEPKPETPERRYSPAEFNGSKKRRVLGSLIKADVSTSHVERQNLTMRMSMRRFTRLTNAFSNKIDNHIYAISLYFTWYNWCRIHKSLRVTPAMAAGLTDKLMSMEDICDLIDARAKKPGKRGTYKKCVKSA
jgi:hypothetical protein